MTKANAKYSKVLLIILGVLAAIVIGFNSNAVSLDSSDDSSVGLLQHFKTLPTLADHTQAIHTKLLSLVK